MHIKIEKQFTEDVKKLRQKTYAEYNYSGIDKIDNTLGPTHKWYINCYRKGRLIGSSRLIKKYLPFREHYDPIETSHNDFELGRLCISDEFTALEKTKVLAKIAKTVIGICLVQNCSKLFAGARCPNNIIYKRLAGFKQISKPQSYPPLEDVYLLALDFNKEYNKRKKKMFDLPDEFLKSIDYQLNGTS